MPIEGYKKHGRSMLDFITAAAEAERKGGITMAEWCRIRRTGTPEEIAEAVERMEAAGGYDNLE
jgi:hypothetical protein